MERVKLPGDISGQEASLVELQVKTGALPVTRAAASIPVRLEGLGLCVKKKGCSYSCSSGFVKVCWAVAFM